MSESWDGVDGIDSPAIKKHVSPQVPEKAETVVRHIPSRAPYWDVSSPPQAQNDPLQSLDGDLSAHATSPPAPVVHHPAPDAAYPTVDLREAATTHVFPTTHPVPSGPPPAALIWPVEDEIATAVRLSVVEDVSLDDPDPIATPQPEQHLQGPPHPVSHHPVAPWAKNMWAADAASRHLGIELLECREGYAKIRMRVQPTMIRAGRTCHDAFVFAVADSAFMYCANSETEVVVGMNADVTMCSPAHLDDVLIAEATQQVRFRRNGLTTVVVKRESDDEVIAMFQGRSRAVAARGAKPTKTKPESTPPPVG